MNDNEKFKRELTKCYGLFKERNAKYGDSWRILSVRSIANLIEMKMNRISTLGEDTPKTKDEMQDTINYAIFALIKLTEKNENIIYNTH